MKTPELAYLSIKIKSLAAEAVIIRKDENRYRAQSKRKPRFVDGKDTWASDHVGGQCASTSRTTWLGLKSHRRQEVRSEARSALLAFGFLRGTPYRAMEAKCWDDPNWSRIATLVSKYSDRKGPAVAMEHLKIWRDVPLDLKQAA